MFQAQDAVSSTKVRAGGLQGEGEKATVPGCLGGAPQSLSIHFSVLRHFRDGFVNGTMEDLGN